MPNSAVLQDPAALAGAGQAVEGFEDLSVLSLPTKSDMYSICTGNTSVATKASAAAKRAEPSSRVTYHVLGLDVFCEVDDPVCALCTLQRQNVSDIDIPHRINQKLRSRPQASRQHSEQRCLVVGAASQEKRCPREAL